MLVAGSPDFTTQLLPTENVGGKLCVVFVPSLDISAPVASSHAVMVSGVKIAPGVLLVVVSMAVTTPPVKAVIVLIVVVVVVVVGCPAGVVDLVAMLVQVLPTVFLIKYSAAVADTLPPSPPPPPQATRERLKSVAKIF